MNVTVQKNYNAINVLKGYTAIKERTENRRLENQCITHHRPLAPDPVDMITFSEL